MPADPPTGSDPHRGRAGRSGGDLPGRRDALVNLLRTSPEPRTILSLAEELGVHANTVRFHLDVLLRTGQVEQVLGDRTGPGRPPVLFRATHRMDPAGPTNYRLLATMLTDHLATSSPDPGAAAAELGRSWGPHLVDAPATDLDTRGRSPATQVSTRARRGEALARITSVLTDLGFAPEPPRPRQTTIRLHHCPFLSLVTGADSSDGYGSVICSLHLGLMQGALVALQAPVTVDRLDPFVEPDLCVAHVAAASPSKQLPRGGRRSS